MSATIIIGLEKTYLPESKRTISPALAIVIPVSKSVGFEIVPKSVEVPTVET